MITLSLCGTDKRAPYNGGTLLYYYIEQHKMSTKMLRIDSCLLNILVYHQIHLNVVCLQYKTSYIGSCLYKCRSIYYIHMGFHLNFVCETRS